MIPYNCPISYILKPYWFVFIGIYLGSWKIWNSWHRIVYFRSSYHIAIDCLTQYHPSLDIFGFILYISACSCIKLLRIYKGVWVQLSLLPSFVVHPNHIHLGIYWCKIYYFSSRILYSGPFPFYWNSSWSHILQGFSLLNGIKYKFPNNITPFSSI